MIRFELALFRSACGVWLLAALALYGVVPLAGTLDVGLRPFFSVAAVLGWLAGNVYIVRLRSLPEKKWRRRLLLSYLLGPPSIVYLLRALAPVAVQRSAPFVPIYALMVYAIFFLVPVTLRHTPVRRRDQD